MAKRLVLMANNKEMDADTLLRCMDFGRYEDRSYSDRFMVLNPMALSTFKTRSLLRLLHMFRFNECEQQRDRIFSLLALCGEGYDVQVDYRWSPEHLTRHVLSCCPTTLCWCSVKTLGEVLGSMGNSIPTRSDELSFVHFTVTSDEQLDALPKYREIALNHLCKECSDTQYLQIVPTLDHPSPTSVETREIDPGRVETQHRQPCTIQLTENGKSITVHLTLSTVLSIAKKIDRNDICDEPSLQLCVEGSNDFAVPAVISCHTKIKRAFGNLNLTMVYFQTLTFRCP